MTLLLNYLISVLLFVTILYCFKLNRKIDRLRQGKEEFANLIRHFDQSIVRAENNIAELKNLTSKTSSKLSTKMDEANVVLDNLSYLTEEVAKLLQVIDKKIKSPTLPKQLFQAANNSTIPPLTELRGAEGKEMVNAMLSKTGSEKTRVLQSLMERIADSGAGKVQQEPEEKQAMDPKIFMDEVYSARNKKTL